MANISVYLNTRASKTDATNISSDFKKYLFRHNVNILNPSNLEELSSSVQSDIDNETDYIFSVGGDGTANIISQQLIGTNIKLMVVPTGTANDLASEIGSSASIKKITKIFQSNKTKRIDSIKINNKHMITNGGVGLVSEVARIINHHRAKSENFKKVMRYVGCKTYSLMLLKLIITESFKLRDYFLESPDYPGLSPIVSSAIILVNNQPSLAGKFKVAPNTKNDDAKFNVTILLHKNKIDLIKEVAPLLLGQELKPSKDIISFETDKLTLNAVDGQPISFFGDGEQLVESPILEIDISPKSLEICTYKGESLIYPSLNLDRIELIQ